MKALIATDAHVFKKEDGSYWTSAIYGYEFWKRYLNVFDEIRVVARCKEINEMSSLIRLDGEGIEVYEIPFFQGPKQLALHFLSIQNKMRKAYHGCDVAIFRMPSQTAQMALWYKPRQMPYAGEVVYDPYDDVANTDTSFLQKTIDRIISFQLKRFCMNANGVSYVTEHSIQRHYPNMAMMYGENLNYFESYYSSINLGIEAFSGPRDYSKKKSFTMVLSDVSMGSDRKGEITLFKAMKEVVDKGYDVYSMIIGDGPYRGKFEKMADELGIRSRVEFVGRLASSVHVREKMMDADIFVFPTMAEGLPRGVLEAMAIGMPVLSTPVGGIPEVIDREFLFAPNDFHEFAIKIEELINNRDKLNEMSKTNYERALGYRSEILQTKRDKFYLKLRKIAERKVTDE